MLSSKNSLFPHEWKSMTYFLCQLYTLRHASIKARWTSITRTVNGTFARFGSFVNCILFHSGLSRRWHHLQTLECARSTSSTTQPERPATCAPWTITDVCRTPFYHKQVIFSSCVLHSCILGSVWIANSCLQKVISALSRVPIPMSSLPLIQGMWCSATRKSHMQCTGAASVCLPGVDMIDG